MTTDLNFHPIPPTNRQKDVIEVKRPLRSSVQMKRWSLLTPMFRPIMGVIGTDHAEFPKLFNHG